MEINKVLESLASELYRQQVASMLKSEQEVSLDFWEKLSEEDKKEYRLRAQRIMNLLNVYLLERMRKWQVNLEKLITKRLKKW